MTREQRCRARDRGERRDADDCRRSATPTPMRAREQRHAGGEQRAEGDEEHDAGEEHAEALGDGEPDGVVLEDLAAEGDRRGRRPRRSSPCPGWRSSVSAVDIRRRAVELHLRDGGATRRRRRRCPRTRRTGRAPTSTPSMSSSCGRHLLDGRLVRRVVDGLALRRLHDDLALTRRPPAGTPRRAGRSPPATRCRGSRTTPGSGRRGRGRRRGCRRAGRPRRPTTSQARR